jgi:membrane protein DedA with SNARE-associated domain
MTKSICSGAGMSESAEFLIAVTLPVLGAIVGALVSYDWGFVAGYEKGLRQGLITGRRAALVPPIIQRSRFGSSDPRDED